MASPEFPEGENPTSRPQVSRSTATSEMGRADTGLLGMLRCKRFWTRVLPRILGSILLLFGISLAFGDPRWTRAHWIFQFYVWPGYGYEHTISAQRPDGTTTFLGYNHVRNTLSTYPAKYTGLCHAYHSNGRLWMAFEAWEGFQQGRFTIYHRNGRKAEFFTTGAHRYIGLHAKWYDNGQLKMAVDPSTFPRISNGFVIACERDGRVNGQKFLVNRKPVTLEAYEAERARDMAANGKSKLPPVPSFVKRALEPDNRKAPDSK